MLHLRITHPGITGTVEKSTVKITTSTYLTPDRCTRISYELQTWWVC